MVQFISAACVLLAWLELSFFVIIALLSLAALFVALVFIALSAISFSVPKV